MKVRSIFNSLALSIVCVACFAQGPYYSGVDLSLTGLDLKDELSAHIISTHSNFLSYSDVWDVLVQSDLNPENSNDVLLYYGYNDTDGSVINDRTRNKTSNGGNVGEWNREHSYPKSLGTPNLGTAGPGSDPHHLRSTDVQMNGNRGSSKYDAGSGNAGNSGSGWYPGDEWKGDAARMMMYMYLRYGDQCLPNNVCNGSTNTIDENMIDLLLDWNAQDPPSEYELTRNDVVENAQGNRNPFIDAPILAQRIWNGPFAADPWGMYTGIQESTKNNIELFVFPNPATQIINVDMDNTLNIDRLELLDNTGKFIRIVEKTTSIDISDLSEGVYFCKLSSQQGITVQRFVVLDQK